MKYLAMILAASVILAFTPDPSPAADKAPGVKKSQKYSASQTRRRHAARSKVYYGSAFGTRYRCDPWAARNLGICL